jgi:hypothetical protein
LFDRWPEDEGLLLSQYGGTNAFLPGRWQDMGEESWRQERFLAGMPPVRLVL